MKKKLIPLILVFVLIFSAFSVPCSAVSGEILHEEVITCDDGSTLTITVLKSPARSSNTVSGSAVYVKRDSSGNELWRCVLNATFTYDGTTSRATLASAEFTSASSNWVKDTLFTYRSSNTAYADLTVIQKFLGITVDTYKYTFSLSCDKDGNLS